MIITFAKQSFAFSFDIAKDAMPSLKHSFLALYSERETKNGFGWTVELLRSSGEVGRYLSTPELRYACKGSSMYKSYRTFGAAPSK